MPRSLQVCRRKASQRKLARLVSRHEPQVDKVGEILFSTVSRLSVATANGKVNESMFRGLQERWSREWELNPRPADYESITYLNEPKPPELSPSKIKDLTFGGFGGFRLILGGLMEL